jgi:4-oxalocrotonate tautomerase
MPTIRVDGPPIDIDTKRRLVKKFSQAAAEAYGIAEEHMIVLIRENAPENVGLGGRLLVDRHRTAEGS